MAFGDLRGTLTGSNISIPNPFDATGSVTVTIGDLIFVVHAEFKPATVLVTAITDNLGNSYTAQNAGSITTSAGPTARAFYSIATVGGALTAVHAADTSGSDDGAIVAGVFAGPFAGSPVDANPANITEDITTPYTCPATGTLAQVSELVLGWIAVALGRTATATSPNLLAISTRSSTEAATNSVSASLGYQVVSATTTVSPEFTFAGGSINHSVLGTMSFKAAAVVTVLMRPVRNLYFKG